MESLKTITIPPIPDASLDLATELKERCGWLDSAEEIQRILGRGSHTMVVEHLRPEFVKSITDQLDALDVDYTCGTMRKRQLKRPVLPSVAHLQSLPAADSPQTAGQN
jgi:hypothetical protein